MALRCSTIPLFVAFTLLFLMFLVVLRFATQTPPNDGSLDFYGNIDSNPEVLSSEYKQYKPRRPHIVFILADDLGYNDIGYHAINGMSAVKTPHLDKLAAEGVKLENYYVQPICSPSRSVLMTGRYLIRYGLQHRLFRAAQPTCLPLSETILPQKLGQMGYVTHAVGKWHLGFCRSECLPTRRGFDSFFGYACGGMDHYLHTKTFLFKGGSLSSYSMNTTYDNSTLEDELEEEIISDTVLDNIQLTDDELQNMYSRQVWTGKDLWENETITWENEGQYSATMFTRRAQDIIEKHDPKKPLFLYLAYKNVHRPLQAPSRYTEMFKHIKDPDRRLMAAMVYILDEGVKNVTNTLKISGLWDNTVFIFSSDNGGMVKSNAAGNNWPLKGGKWTFWEGGIRSVGFVNSALLSNKVKGTVNKALLHISDWFPTFVDGIAGGNTTKMTKPLDGLNQWDVISKGYRGVRKEILYNIDPLEAFPKMSQTEAEFWGKHLTGHQSINPLIRAGIRSGDWKMLTGALVGNAMWLPPPESGLRKQFLRNMSIHCGRRGSVVRLFNIRTDPKETCNLARNTKYLAIVKHLFRKLRTYYDEAVPVYYPEEDPMANPALRGGAWTPWLDNDLETYIKIYPFRSQPYM